MDRNSLLAFGLSFLVLTTWMIWESENRPPSDESANIALEAEGGESNVAGQLASPGSMPAAPSGTDTASGTSPADPSSPADRSRWTPSEAAAPAQPEATAQVVEIRNGMALAELSSRGAVMTRWELLTYHASESEGGQPILLIDRTPEELGAFATAFAELGLGDLSRQPFRVVAQSERSATFEFTSGGVTVAKTYLLDEDSYVFRLRVEVRNGGSQPLAPGFVVALPQQVREGSDFAEMSLTALAAGSVERELLAGFGTSGILSSVTGSAPEREMALSGGVDWTGVSSHYFLTAMLPDVPRDAEARWLATDPGNESVIAVGYRPVTIPTGSSVERELRVFAGPMNHDQLVAVGAQLDRAVDVGWAWIAPLTNAFNWMLALCYSVIPNYGVAIIILTILVRLVTAPLAVKQMKSMKRLGEIQPKMKAIQERYADDRQTQSQEMMKLYKETGVNPLGGCFPMLLQIPVFIGLYYALRSSIALRQAPFVLWIDDLSIPETLFTIPGIDLPIRLLPLLMGASMVLQQRMTPTSMDPAQARMMMTVMPVMFTFLFYGFPSGLVLYWFVSNLLAIGQQALINSRSTTTG